VKRKSTMSVSRPDVASKSDLMRGLFCSVIDFMRRTGMSATEIRDVFMQCNTASGQCSRGKRGDANSLSYGRDTVAGAVLRAWHRFPRYMNSFARPRPLRLGGAEPNVASLILGQDKNADVEQVVRSMLRAGLIRKRADRTYVPKKDLATIEALDPLLIDHIAKAVIRLVETATGNAGTSRSQFQLIERYAHVPDLAPSEGKSFASYSRQQGQACLDAVEDWLETRQVRRRHGGSRPRSGLSAGVHIFAFLEGRAPKRQRQSAPRGKKLKRAPAAPA
jgi:hypothetical protein